MTSILSNSHGKIFAFDNINVNFSPCCCSANFFFHEKIFSYIWLSAGGCFVVKDVLYRKTFCIGGHFIEKDVL
jgi:hypothetical protein